MLHITTHQENANQTTMKCHLTPVSNTFMKKARNNKCWQGCRGKGNPHALCVGMSVWAATAEQSREVPQKTKNRATTSPSYLTSGCILEGNEIMITETALCSHAYGSTTHNDQDTQTT